ncbi:MAG: four helix bundle protein [Opitutaceae bacterium]|nr:four helix bundle protein [Opitutaceae bacterium]
MESTIRSYRDLRTYQAAFALQQRIFKATQTFPGEERFALTDQIRRSSRSIGANLAEA